jgi:hypothetical protein
MTLTYMRASGPLTRPRCACSKGSECGGSARIAMKIGSGTSTGHRAARRRGRDIRRPGTGVIRMDGARQALSTARLRQREINIDHDVRGPSDSSRTPGGPCGHWRGGTVRRDDQQPRGPSTRRPGRGRPLSAPAEPESLACEDIDQVGRGHAAGAMLTSKVRACALVS